MNRFFQYEDGPAVMKILLSSFLVLSLMLLGVVGCAEPTNEIQESTNEIQDFLKNNPDSVERAEDQAPSDESVMFDESATVE